MEILIKKETAEKERRVALTPEFAKKIIDLGFKVFLEKDAGKKAGFLNKEYQAIGCEVVEDKTDVDVVFCVSSITADLIKKLEKNTTLIGLLKPVENSKILESANKKHVNMFALEYIPRITRAQSMDVLSSQNNLAGYRAVIEGVFEYEHVLPLMMTAAGTIHAAKVLVIGAGVAGLQAIATAKRLGAIVSAFDVRTAAKEQVESLGAKFIQVESDESGDGAGGYAKEMSEEYKKAQAQKLHETLKSQDIVITTAQIPNLKAPILITQEMVDDMKHGSVLVDLAIDTGGNCEASKEGVSITKNGVKIVAHSNLVSKIAHDASKLFAKNVFTFFQTLIDAKTKSLSIDVNDEIVKGSCLMHDGNFVNDKWINKN